MGTFGGEHRIGSDYLKGCIKLVVQALMVVKLQVERAIKRVSKHLLLLSIAEEGS